MKKLLSILFTAVILVSFNAFADEEKIQIRKPWGRSATMGANTAVYMKIINLDSKDHELIGVESSLAKTVELHKTVTEDGVSKMVPVDKLMIPAGQTVKLKPKGLHVMLFGLTKDLKAGDYIELKLVFKDLDKKIVQASVLKANR